VTSEEAESFRRCIAGGGVALFPADTVYGLAADPESERAVRRLYELKGRPPSQPAAVMFFELDAALAALPDLGERTRAALPRLLPGGLTVLLPNPTRRFPLACGPEPERIGLRVPELSGTLAALAGAGWPVLQSSANPSGGPDARTLEDVEASLRRGVDLALDGGELPGVPSTVVDLTGYEEAGEFAVLRAGAVPREMVEERL
jgi:L-threonylcarbamoyladenylate synthase